MSRTIQKLKKALITAKRAIDSRLGPCFECPICGYVGSFRSVSPPTGVRKYARCPVCNALERHRLQYLVIESLMEHLPCSCMAMLHFAPEVFFVKYFREHFGRYETADLHMDDVDHKVDLTDLPFMTASVDFVFASHVLEHIQDDKKAIAEIRRILKPGGIAVLPVPLVALKTIEYNHPFFNHMKVIGSDAFPGKYQLYIYEDRSRYPTPDCPQRPAMIGKRHSDIVPICYC
ncbi:MAG: class I SAM-dependent methyltransferase [Syntrophaceae bacterium]|nr:class I SAM-dependent methyltransferase [Syntrophaceae bacterium]